ncbi:MAG: DUF1566 domain-containing protein [bacterium]|nr:DUF1566 domain-containing protein [bacterium]
MKKRLLAGLAILTGMLLLSASIVCAQSAPVAKTGQTTCYDASGIVIDCTDTGQDGDHQAGVSYPDPRFTDNSNGTVTDNLTGLVWLKDANRFGTKNWTTALSDCNSLADDGVNLTDGSSAGDWRLPNTNELESLSARQYYNPAVSNTVGTGQLTAGDPFTNVQSSYYWSATTLTFNKSYAWFVYMLTGVVSSNNKSNDYYIWPVRSGNFGQLGL